MKRIRDYGVNVGKLQTGERNKITDVKGVKVGHVTLRDGDVNTGVTAILPHDGNMFKDKVYGAIHVINGFGKTVGTMQLEELGTIETPIMLTNTLNVGIVSQGLVRYMLSLNTDIGVETGTINPIVGECNDGFLNDIRGLHVKEEHVFKSINNASVDFLEGAVGAGTGMSCFGYKGGIGSSSRKINIKDEEYTLGALVLSNFGIKEDFILNNNDIKAMLYENNKSLSINNKSCDIDNLEKGSIMMILATDAPLSPRQLKRVAKRSVVGITRLGSYLGNGSGDVVIAFSTANKIKHYEESVTSEVKMINENYIDFFFRASAEAVEESVLNSLITAETVVGRNGNRIEGLSKSLGL
ncbi:P1 family peptidase [Clostridium sp.]|uniref:DmpA family aminopeptidase n=1 Tax=Clostridium sp. TaxID=1506 RepID=UPI0032174FA1